MGREPVAWRNVVTYAPLQAVDFSRGISTAWANVIAFVPKFLAFLVILIVGLIVAKILEKVLDKVLERVGFDRLVERGGVKQALSRSRYDASGILGRILYYAVVLFTLSTAFGVFGRNPISDYLRAVIAYLPRVFAAVIILVVAAAIAAAVRSLVDNLLGGLSYGPALATLASAAIIGVVVVAVGGGGIGPMAERWRALLARYDEEKPRVQQTASARGEQLKAQAQDTASRLGDDRRGDGGSHPLR